MIQDLLFYYGGMKVTNILKKKKKRKKKKKSIQGLLINHHPVCRVPIITPQASKW